MRQKIVARALPTGSYDSAPEAFHLWLRLPAVWGRREFAAAMAVNGIAVVMSDSFAVSTDGSAPEAVRVCIGGIADRYQIVHAVGIIAEALRHPPVSVTQVV